MLVLLVVLPSTIECWAAENVRDAAARPLRPKSIVIEGESRTGKTEWARSLGPHNYLCGHLDLNNKIYSNNAWYNIIDNVDPHYLKHFKEFMGAQSNWSSKVKYGRPVKIKGGIPTIFLCNPGPTSSYKEFLEEEKNIKLKNWSLHNAEFYTITQPLFVQEMLSQWMHRHYTRKATSFTYPDIKKRQIRRRRLDLPCGCSIFKNISCSGHGYTHRGIHHCSTSDEWRLVVYVNHIFGKY